MKVAKIIFQQTLIVHFLMSCVIVIIEIASVVSNGEAFYLSWYIPISLLAVAFLTSLPTVIFYITPEFTGALAVLRIVLHYILLLGVVLGSGILFNWYNGMAGLLGMIVVFTVIYVLVWVFTSLLFKHDEKIINAALEKVRDEE